MLIPDPTPNEFGFNIVRKTYTNISDDSVHFIVWRKKYFILNNNVFKRFKFHIISRSDLNPFFLDSGSLEIYNGS